MKIRSQKEKEIQEIFQHIKKIRHEQNVDSRLNELNPLEIIKSQTGKIAGELSEEDFGPEDVFEIVGPVIETQQESKGPVSKMSLNFGSVGICDICGEKIIFEKNLAGLVVNDKFFACETCCQDASKVDLDNWTESKNAKPENVRPIAFWLMQIKNKNRLM